MIQLKVYFTLKRDVTITMENEMVFGPLIVLVVKLKDKKTLWKWSVKCKVMYVNGKKHGKFSYEKGNAKCTGLFLDDHAAGTWEISRQDSVFMLHYERGHMIDYFPR